MLQLEVVEKICGKRKSLLSWLVEVSAEVQYEFLVSADFFTPKPQVDSAIISFVFRGKPLISEKLQPYFRQILKAGFQQKRKKIINDLRSLNKNADEIFLGKIDDKQRAENLNLKDWIILTETWMEFSQENISK